MAPYSGHMLASAARSGSVRWSSAAPEYSTIWSTTPAPRSTAETCSAMSVAVTPAAGAPVSSTWQMRGNGIGTGEPSAASSASIPPTPQPSTPSALTMVVWLSVPITVSAMRRPCASGTGTLPRVSCSRLIW